MDEVDGEGALQPPDDRKSAASHEQGQPVKKKDDSGEHSVVSEHPVLSTRGAQLSHTVGADVALRLQRRRALIQKQEAQRQAAASDGTDPQYGGSYEVPGRDLDERGPLWSSLLRGARFDEGPD